MNSFWLTYKPAEEAPDLGWPAKKLTELVKRFEHDRINTTEWWRCASSKKAHIGDRVYIFKQGSGNKGIFGVGNIVKGPETRKSFSPGKEAGPQVEINFINLVDPSDGRFLLYWSQISDMKLGDLPKSMQSGNIVEEDIAKELEKRLAPWITSMAPRQLESNSADDGLIELNNAHDERERMLRAIRIRRGQSIFRSRLLEVYKSQCVITRCNIPDVLEAAHIMPYSVTQVNDTSNGLLLRADIHTLFDCNLISINPDTLQVVIDKSLEASVVYAKLSGKKLLSPGDICDGPTKRNLQWRFAEFEAQKY